jgi:hypothetical protein
VIRLIIQGFHGFLNASHDGGADDLLIVGDGGNCGDGDSSEPRYVSHRIDMFGLARIHWEDSTSISMRHSVMK